MTDSVEELIKEIAVKHGIAVGRDDPIMILQTLNRRLMQESQKAQETMLNQYKEELEGIAARWEHEAKEKAERILNAALVASKEVMSKTMQDSAVAATALIHKEVEDVLVRTQAQLCATRNLAIWNITVAVITLLSSGFLGWVVVFNG